MKRTTYAASAQGITLATWARAALGCAAFALAFALAFAISGLAAPQAAFASDLAPASSLVPAEGEEEAAPEPVSLVEAEVYLSTGTVKHVFSKEKYAAAPQVLAVRAEGKVIPETAYTATVVYDATMTKSCKAAKITAPGTYYLRIKGKSSEGYKGVTYARFKVKDTSKAYKKKLARTVKSAAWVTAAGDKVVSYKIVLEKPWKMKKRTVKLPNGQKIKTVATQTITKANGTKVKRYVTSDMTFISVNQKTNVMKVLVMRDPDHLNNAISNAWVTFTTIETEKTSGVSNQKVVSAAGTYMSQRNYNKVVTYKSKKGTYKVYSYRGKRVDIGGTLASGAQECVNFAKAELKAWNAGKTPADKYLKHWKAPETEETWCTEFAGYCLDMCGLTPGKTMPTQPIWTLQLVDFYNEHPKYGTVNKSDGTYVPKVGDILIVMDGDFPAHAEIVASANKKAGTFQCVGGGEAVTLNTHSIKDNAGNCFITINWARAKADS